MPILVLLGMYFDAAMVFAKTFLLLFRLALAILCYNYNLLETFHCLHSYFNRGALSWNQYFLNNHGEVCNTIYNLLLIR